MWNTSTTTFISHTTEWYSTSAAATNGNKKIITEWNTFTKSIDCKG